MKKIAFITGEFCVNNLAGGGNRVNYNFLKKLIEHNYIVDIYCNKSDVEEFEGINKIINIKTPYNHKDSKLLKLFYNEVKRKIGQTDYECIISGDIYAYVGITIKQCHTTFYALNLIRNPLFKTIYKFLKKKRLILEKEWAEQNTEKVIVPSQMVKDDIVKNLKIPENLVIVVYPGIEFPKTCSKQINSVFTFGISAPGIQNKGGYIFLKSLYFLKRQGYDFKARIIYPRYNSNFWVKFLVKLYGIGKNVEFLSFQNNMNDFYNSIDCLIMPSINEAFGLVALEALANKTPCIISSNSGITEVIEHSKECLVFDINKNASKNLANQMIFAISNPDKLKILAENGYNKIKNYNWDKTFNCFINAIFKM